MIGGDVLEIQNSYILLYKHKQNKKNAHNINNNKDGTIVLTTKVDDPVRDYFSECFAEIEKIEKITGFYAKYKCRLKNDKNFSVIIVLRNIKADYYIDVIVSGKTRERIIHKMELIHSSLNKTNICEEYTFIVSYDSISEYYCNKMSDVLNELERKLRKLLYLIYTARYRDEYIKYTFVDNLLSPVSKEQVISRLKKQADSKDKRTLEQRFFEEFEYQHYNHLLFFPKWTSVDIQNKEEFFSESQNWEEIDKEKIYQKIKEFLPQSDWERFYSGNVKNSDLVENLMSDIKQQRNKVAHYKTISRQDYMAFMRSANELFTIINDAMELTTTKEFFEQFKKRFFESHNEVMKKMMSIFEQHAVNLVRNVFDINMYDEPELESEDGNNGEPITN